MSNRISHLIDSAHAESDTLQLESAETEIRRLAREADDWRKSRGWTQDRFVKEYRNLSGDSKTFSLFRDKEPSTWDRKAEDWILKYRQLKTALRDYDLRVTEGPLLNLKQSRDFARFVGLMRRETGLRRALLVEGDSGSGKSTLLRQLHAQVGESRLVMLRGRASWCSYSVMLEAWLRALGAPLPRTKRPLPSARLHSMVSEALATAGDIIVAVDEWHYTPPQGINAIKDWITDAAEAESKVHFVLAAVPTLFSSLTGRYPEESKQLVRNRLFARLELQPPDAAEVKQLLACQLPHIPDEERLLPMLAKRAAASGGRAYIRDVASVAATHKHLDAGTLEEIAKSIAHKNR